MCINQPEKQEGEEVFLENSPLIITKAYIALFETEDTPIFSYMCIFTNSAHTKARTSEMSHLADLGAPDPLVEQRFGPLRRCGVAAYETTTNGFLAGAEACVPCCNPFIKMQTSDALRSMLGEIHVRKRCRAHSSAP